MKKAVYKVFRYKGGHKTSDKNRNRHQVQCNICELQNFDIDRYKCLICTSYDICAECFEKRLESEQHSTGKIIFLR